MKHLRTLLLIALALFGSISTHAQSNNPVDFYPVDMSGIQLNWVRQYSSNTNYVAGLNLNGIKFRSATNLSTVLLMLCPDGKWRRYPWTFGHPASVVDGGWLSFDQLPISTDNPALLRLGIFPKRGSGRDLAYIDASGKFVQVSETSAPPCLDLEVANCMTNRIRVYGTNSTGGRIWRFDLPTVPDWQCLPNVDLTKSRFVPFFKPGHWITNPPPAETTNNPAGTNTPSVVVWITNNVSTPIYIGKMPLYGIPGTGRGILSGGSSTGSGGTGDVQTTHDSNENPEGDGGSGQSGRVSASLEPISRSYTDSASFLAAFESAGPVYQSRGLETNLWNGTYIAYYATAVYVHSDDGARVTINGVVVYDTFGGSQGWDNFEKSAAFLVCLPEGTTNKISVLYSNVKYSGSGDNDDGIALSFVEDRTDARISGPANFPYFWRSGSAQYTYTLNAPAKDITWTTSSNLRIVSTNTLLQNIKVVAGGASGVPGGDWVEASWNSVCGGSHKARYYLTIEAPVSLQQGAVTLNNKAGGVGASIKYTVLNQFGTPFSHRCNATEVTWATGSTSSGFKPMPDQKDVLVIGSSFTDEIWGTAGFNATRGQVWYVHAPGETGEIVWMARILYGATGITVTRVGVTGD